LDTTRQINRPWNTGRSRNKFRSSLSGVIADVALDYEHQPGFSISYLQTDDYATIEQILATEFRDFFTRRQTLSLQTYERLRPRGIEEQRSPGEVLWKIGELGNWFCVVLEGELEIRGESGTVIRTVPRGGIDGELSALDGLPRSATALARTRTNVLRIPGGALRELVHLP
jgi:CRP-like cAMP-binding protein